MYDLSTLHLDGNSKTAYFVSVDPYGSTAYLIFPDCELIIKMDRPGLHNLNAELLRAERLIDYLKANPTAVL